DHICLPKWARGVTDERDPTTSERSSPRSARVRNFRARAPSEGPKTAMKISRVAPFAFAAFAAVSATFAATYATDASACGMSVRLDPTPQKPTPVQEIARAEKALEAGQNLAAAQAVLGTFPRIRNATAGANPLETRALRVFALALVRSD